MLSDLILEHAHGLGEGGVFSVRGLVDLASPAAVDQSLSQLVRDEKLVSIGHGIYAVPTLSRFGKLPPETAKVIAFLERETGEPIMPHGIAAANQLGLTSQVPVRKLYVTSGQAIVLHFGKNKVRIEHAPRWQTQMPHREAGAAIRAMSWLGEPHAREAAGRLSRSLPREEWLALVSARPSLPWWMADAIDIEGQGLRPGSGFSGKDD